MFDPIATQVRPAPPIFSQFKKPDPFLCQMEPPVSASIDALEKTSESVTRRSPARVLAGSHCCVDSLNEYVNVPVGWTPYNVVDDDPKFRIGPEMIFHVLFVAFQRKRPPATTNGFNGNVAQMDAPHLKISLPGIPARVVHVWPEPVYLEIAVPSVESL